MEHILSPSIDEFATNPVARIGPGLEKRYGYADLAQSHSRG